MLSRNASLRDDQSLNPKAINSGIGFQFVMPGLVPGIHALAVLRQEKRGWPGQATGHDGKRLILKPPNLPTLQLGGEKLPDGQISKNLSSPFAKNISLSPSGKSVV
jgi:hypothetical protein